MLKHLLRGGGSDLDGNSWVATLGASLEFGFSVAVAPDGSVYVCGKTESGDVGGYVDLLLAKFSSSGTVQWKKALGGSEADGGQSVAVAPDGSVYVCGYTAYGSYASEDLLLAKFSSSGTMQWYKVYGSNGIDIGYSVAVAPDGSVYVCGRTYSSDAGGDNLLLAKFSNSGTVQWQKALGGTRLDLGYSVAVAPDGSVYVYGMTYSVDTGGYDFLLAKFRSSGTLQWQKILSGRGNEYGESVAVAPDGSVYVCGYTEYGVVGSYDAFLAKFSSSGTVQWQKELGGSGLDYGYSVAVAPDGSVYVSGETRSAGAGIADILLAKFSSSGTVQWQKALGSGNYEHGYSVAVAPDGSVYVCGKSDRGLLLAKITDSLIEQDTVTFGSFTFQDVSLTSNNVSLTVTSSSLSVSNAGLTVKTTSLTEGTASLTTKLYTL